jgi:hypothetical protein
MGRRLRSKDAAGRSVPRSMRVSVPRRPGGTHKVTGREASLSKTLETRDVSHGLRIEKVQSFHQQVHGAV